MLIDVMLALNQEMMSCVNNNKSFASVCLTVIFVIGSIMFLMSCVLDILFRCFFLWYCSNSRKKNSMCIIDDLNFFLQSVNHFSHNVLTMILDLIQVVMLIIRWICIRKNNCMIILSQWYNLSASLWVSYMKLKFSNSKCYQLWHLIASFCRLEDLLGST